MLDVFFLIANEAIDFLIEEFADEVGLQNMDIYRNPIALCI